MANFEVCNWFFKKSPFVCCENGTSKKNTVIIRLMSLFGSYILGIFFHVKIKIIDDFNDEFLICKWQVNKIFFLTSWTWTKNGVLNFKCTRFKLHKHFSNVSQFPFMNTSSNFINDDKAITCLKKKTHPCFRWFLLRKKGHPISEDNSGMKETGKPEPLKTNVAMKHFKNTSTEL